MSFASLGAWADDALEPRMVVATRTPVALEWVSPSFSLTEAGTLETFKISDLNSALQREAGIFIARTGATGAQTSVFTRGTQSNHTSFFLNGRRLNPTFGSDFNIAAISVESGTDVQIARGPSSVLFGAEGIGGTIELRSELPESGRRTALEAEYGTNQFRQARWNHQIAEGPLRVGIAGTFTETENERRNNEFKRVSVLPQISYALTEAIELDFIGSYLEFDGGLPNDRFTNSLVDFQENRSWLFSPGLRIVQGESRLTAFYSRSEDRLIASTTGFFGTTFNQLDVASDELNVQYDWQANDQLLLTLGGLVRHDQTERFDLATQDSIYENTTTQTGAFVQAQYAVTEDFEVRLGGRYDRFTDYKNPLTGSIETIYRFEPIRTTLFARLATAYAPPTPADFGFAFGTVPELDPEESTAYEIGFRQVILPEKLKWSATLFRNEISNLIDFDFVTFAPVNVSRARTEGLETSFEWTPTSKLTITGNYSYLHAIKQGGGFSFDPTADRRLARRPRHMLNLAIAATPVEAVTLALEGRAVIDRRDFDPEIGATNDAPDFIILRLAGEWRATANTSVIARVENLLDRSYEEILGFPALGRSVYLGIRTRF